MDFPPPDFVEPAGAELRIELSRDFDLDLDLSGVEAGRTVLMIDGESVGPLLSSSPIGAILDQRLLVYLRGAMVPGEHALQLVTFDDVENESSEVVKVFLEPLAAPVVGWAPSGDPLATGDALVPAGPGARGVLGVVDFASDPPRLHAWRTDARSWDRGSTRTLALPGLRRRTGERGAAVSAVVDGPAASATLRVAWRVDAPGSAIAAVEVPWATSDDGAPTMVLVPESEWLGAREWVDVVRPMLAGDMLLAELVAPGDAEQARPGDRVVATVALARIDEPGAPQLVQLGVVDLDRLAHVVDPLVEATGTSDAVLVRSDHREPIVLDVDREARTVRRRASTVDAGDARWNALVGPPAASAAAFGSRIVAGTDGDQLLLGMLADRGTNAPVLAQVGLEGERATGDPALAWIDGVPVVLVPRGDADVLAVPVTSALPRAQALAGLACDAMIGPSTIASSDDRVGTIACLRARELKLLVLRLE